MRNFYTHLKNSLLDVFFAPVCVSCKKATITQQQKICTSCLKNLPRAKYYNLKENKGFEKFKGILPIKYVLCYFYYFNDDSRIRNILHSMKYHNRKDLCYEMGYQLGQEMMLANQDYSFDLIVPVPLHKKKLLKRGYNQSLHISRGIQSILKIPIWEDFLFRIKNTGSQTNKNNLEREMNVKKVFKVNPSKDASNKHVLIVDDVLTTGATLESCSKEILALFPQCQISFACIAIAN